MAAILEVTLPNTNDARGVNVPVVVNIQDLGGDTVLVKFPAGARSIEIIAKGELVTIGFDYRKYGGVIVESFFRIFSYSSAAQILLPDGVGNYPRFQLDLAQTVVADLTIKAIY